MLTRKKSMRQAYAEKCLREGFPKRKDRPAFARKAAKAPKPRKHLKRVSAAREREMRLYYKERAEWLALPQNSRCAVCLCLGVNPAPATECHHRNGRIGKLLRYKPYWVPCCRACREIPHERPAWAREVGLLANGKDWNVFPR